MPSHVVERYIAEKTGIPPSPPEPQVTPRVPIQDFIDQSLYPYQLSDLATWLSSASSTGSLKSTAPQRISLLGISRDTYHPTWIQFESEAAVRSWVALRVQALRGDLEPRFPSVFQPLGRIGTEVNLSAVLVAFCQAEESLLASGGITEGYVTYTRC